MIDKRKKKWKHNLQLTVTIYLSIELYLSLDSMCFTQPCWKMWAIQFNCINYWWTDMILMIFVGKHKLFLGRPTLARIFFITNRLFNFLSSLKKEFTLKTVVQPIAPIVLFSLLFLLFFVKHFLWFECQSVHIQQLRWSDDQTGLI